MPVCACGDVGANSAAFFKFCPAGIRLAKPELQQRECEIRLKFLWGQSNGLFSLLATGLQISFGPEQRGRSIVDFKIVGLLF